MEWTALSLPVADDLYGDNQPLPTSQKEAFEDITESSFHADQSLLADTGQLYDLLDFELLEGSFHEEDSLVRELLLNPLDETVQIGGGQTDYNIQLVKEKTLKTMGVKEVTYELTFNDRLFRQQKKMKEVNNLLKEAFDKMILDMKKDLRPGDIMRGVIHNDGLDIPVYIPFRPMEDMNAEAMLNCLENVLNSNEDVLFDSSCRIDVGAIKYPRGGRGMKMSNLTRKSKKKLSVVEIRNLDNMCFIRATLVALASTCRVHLTQFQRLKALYPTYDTGEILIHFATCPTWYYIELRQNKKGAQDLLTRRVCETLGIVTNQALTYAYIPLLEDFLNVNIYVVSARMGDAFSYISRNHDEERKKIFLYHEDIEDSGHFHAITKITGFFARSRFCLHCLKAYEHSYQHSCRNHCNVCLSDDCGKEDTQICSDCHRTCRSMTCFLRHKLPTKSGDVPCEVTYKCPECLQTFRSSERKREDHRCGYFTCQSCSQYVEPDHLCYARAYSSMSADQRRYIFADIEASQRDEIIQCEFGYAPQLVVDCSRCQDQTCSDCRLCQHCQKSHCGRAKHSFVLAVCQTACYKCEKEDLNPNSTCSYCGDRCGSCSKVDKKSKKYVSPPCPGRCGNRERVFKTLYDMGVWMFSESHKGFTIFFHNLSYDGSFLLQYLLSQTLRPSFIIYRGSKIQMFNVDALNIRVLDSYNFLPMALAKLPKAFQLDSLKKGYFPHFFTSANNLNYVGTYPPAETYGPHAMSVEGRLEFYKWYESKIADNAVFDFQKEMLEYCRSDVDILRRACLKFKNLLWEATSIDGGHGVDAFESCTIASLCMNVFKTKFLPEDWNILVQENNQERWLLERRLNGKATVWYQDRWIPSKDLGLEILKEEFVSSPIARPPPKGYHSKVNFSKKSIAWLEWLRHCERKEGRELDIKHALTSNGEYRIPGTRYSVDGYVMPSADNRGGVAYEFHGCRYHGCPVCYKNQEIVLVPGSKQTALELLALTKRKENRLRELGLKVVVCWEHDFDALLKTNPEAKAFVDQLDLVDRLDPRDSLMGGRTNGCTLYKKATKGMMIHYVDFTSLYPFVNKTCQYPVGHPEIITRDFSDLSSYFGLAKVKILPPRGLFHPVLGYRTGGKLTFPLCRTCVENQHQSPCTCSDDQRALTGTFCTPELIKAIEKGYRVLKIYEVYHWKETSQYDPKTQTGGLFASYINLFLKIKQEASGRPSWVKSDEDLRRYVEKYEQREGIKLDSSKVEHNAGLRSLAKLLLNSFWGKFGQRQNQTKTKFLHDSQASELFGQLTNPTMEVVDFQIVNDENLMLSTKRISEELCLPGHTNVFLASFTTCWARLQLYDLLDRLQTRVLYWDTDSVIFTSIEGQWNPPVGDYLGELTNELDEDDWITEFVCNGPKNYAYQTHKGKRVCKVKGFSLNFDNSQILNLESMKDAMFNRNELGVGNYQTKNPSKICREKIQSEIYSQEEVKQYSAVYTKRVVQTNLSTLPYGY